MKKRVLFLISLLIITTFIVSSCEEGVLFAPKQHLISSNKIDVISEKEQPQIIVGTE